MGTNTTADSSPMMVTSIRLTRDEHARLRAIAAENRRSLANQLRQLIADYDLADEREAA